MYHDLVGDASVGGEPPDSPIIGLLVGVAVVILIWMLA